MTRGEIWKDFFKKTVLPVVVALLIFLCLKSTFTEDGQANSANSLYAWLLCGIPFGIHRMYVWLVPRGHAPDESVAILLVNIIVGAIIGWAVLIWRLIVAVWYIPLTIYRLLTVDKGAPAQINTKI